MSHCVVKVEDEAVRGEQTVDFDDFLGVRDVDTQVVKIGTCFEVSGCGTTEHRELCGFAGDDVTFDVATFGYGVLVVGGNTFACEGFEEKSQTVSGAIALD